MTDAGSPRSAEDPRRLADRLLKLQSVTDAALGNLTLEELLGELLERMRAILEGDTCAILLLDEGSNELVARAAKGIEEEVERGVRIPVGRGFAGRVAAERRPVVIDDVDHAEILNPILREKGIKSLIGAPLLSRGRVLGVIHVGTLAPRQFTDDDAELLQHAAERAAMGVETALLHERLIQLDRVRHAFVSVASHELRTPAAAILGAALTLAERENLADEKERELKNVLADQARRLAALIEQLLDFSRLEAQAVEIKPRRLAIGEQLDEIVARFATDRPSQVTVRAPADLEADVDPVALERVVENLVGNALRHGAPPVVVTAERADRYLRVTIEDNGGGVPAEMRDRIFDPFVRGAPTSATPGSGLGLAIAKSYANAHGGDLIYEQLGGGACFKLVLPAESG